MTAQAEFTGARARVGPLTWGQLGVWKAIEDLRPDDHWLNQRVVVDMPRRRAVDIASGAEAVGRLIERHESLRTRILRSGAELVQAVAGAGRLPIEVLRVTAAGSTARARAADLAERLAGTPFSYAQDWPLRVGFVVVDAAVTHIVLVLSHAAADRYALDIVARDLRLLVLRGAIATPASPQPLDLAERQRRDERRTDEALAYWTAQYARFPAVAGPCRVTPDADGPPAETRYRNVLLTSPALAAAARTVAERTRTGSGTVLLAAAAELLGRHSDQTVVGVLAMVGNRHQAEHRDVVSPMSQLALVVVDLAGRPPFDQLVGRTFQASLRAYRHAYYDQAALDAAVVALGRGHRSRLDPQCCFNDLRLPDHGDGTPSNSAPAVGAGHTELVWETMDRFNWRWYLEVRDTPAGLCLALGADTRYLPASEMERFVRDLERRVVDAATGPTTRTSGR